MSVDSRARRVQTSRSRSPFHDVAEGRLIRQLIARFVGSPAGRWAVLAVLVGYWVLLAVMTHIPVQPKESIPYLDKVVHFGAYAVLGGLAWLCVQAVGLKLTPWAVFVLLAIYGGLDELLQIPVGRTCDIFDWIADCVGLMTGITTARWLVGEPTAQEQAPV